MSVRVNLLKPTEFRRQGVVSVPFLVQTGITTAIAIVLIVSGLLFLQYERGRRNLKAAQAIWQVREPLYNTIPSIKQDIAAQKKLRQELRGWQVSRLEWKPFLAELQKICPANVQYRRLNIRGDIDVKQRPAPPPVEGQEPAPAPLGSPMRWFVVTLDGKACGEMADDVVVQFVRAMGNDALFKSIFDAPPKLNSMQRDAEQSDGQADRTFTIEGSTLKREMRETKRGS
jgi:hypothetical protein